MILVTGAAGSVGRELLKRLPHASGTDSAWYDRHLDVTDADEVRHWFKTLRPKVVFHLAGAKHAPAGELDPFHVLNVNAVGTQNVLNAAGDAKVILASTCKACDPETAYGASKLVAERMVLNAGGVVVRYFNIPESDGNIFRQWETIPEDEPIPWTDCWRYFVSMQASVELTIAAMDLPTGRYAPAPGYSQHMRDVAQQRYPGRELMQVPTRRGDRYREPLHAVCEYARETNGYLEITSQHDPLYERALRAA